MASGSPSRGRSPARSHTPTSVHRAPSPGPHRSRSPRRSPSPRSRSRSHTRSPPRQNLRNGHGRGRSGSRSLSRSKSPGRGDRRTYRERSYTRSPSRESRRAQSSKIVIEKLTKNVTEAHLREIFGSYGRIESVDLPLNKQCMSDLPSCNLPLTCNSHDKSWHGIRPLRPPVRLRVCHCTHARGATRWRGHFSERRSPSPCLFTVAAPSQVRQARSATTSIRAAHERATPG